MCLEDTVLNVADTATGLKELTFSRGDNETVIIDMAKTAMGEITSEELPSQTRGPEQVSQRELGCVQVEV